MNKVPFTLTPFPNCIYMCILNKIIVEKWVFYYEHNLLPARD